MIRLYLIRHGQTPGNKLQRYIGTTDEPLSTEGKEFLEKLTYPMPEALYVSPLCRCVETAGILFPGKSFHIIEELSECDFGEFENKNYKELSGNQDYQRWIDSNATIPFPGGESREGFRSRCLLGWKKVISVCQEQQKKSAAVVTHGGVIMNLMETVTAFEKSFYEWHVKNLCGYSIYIEKELEKNGKLDLTCGTDGFSYGSLHW